MKKNVSEYFYNHSNGYYVYHLEATPNGNGTTKHSLHYESDFSIFYFKKGTGNIKIEGRQYDISEGDVVIVNPNELYQLNVDGDKIHERISLHVSETILKYFPGNDNTLFTTFYQKQKGKKNRIPAKLVKMHGINSELESIIESAQQNDPVSKILSICKIVEFLINLSRTVFPQNTDYDHVLENPLVNKIIKYIRTHLKENITLETIAENFNVGKSYLSHLFKEKVGISLWNYVIIRRIHLFNKLIKDGDSVEETCYNAGFRNYSNFYRLYKKHIGMSPNEFKNKYHNIKK